MKIHPGNAAWPQAEPLLASAWPPEVRATSSWSNVAWASAQQRLLVWNDGGELVCHVGIHLRHGRWNDTAVRIGGISGVVTRQDSRRHGHATSAIRVAIDYMKETDEADFGVLFCEPDNFAFYRRRGWRQFAGSVFAEQPAGRVRFDAMTAFVLDLRLAPENGTLDLSGLPW